MKRIINIFILISLWQVCAFAQTFEREIVTFPGAFNGFVVEGINIGTTEYSEEDLIEAFGEWDERESTLNGVQYTYLNKGTSEHLIRNDEQFEMILTLQKTINQSKGRVSNIFIYQGTYSINSNIHIGDNIAFAKKLPGKWFDRPDGSNDGGYMIWRPPTWTNCDLVVCPQFHYDATGKIISIKFVAD